MPDARLTRLPILDRANRVIGHAIEVAGSATTADALATLTPTLLSADLEALGGGQTLLLPWLRTMLTAEGREAIRTAAGTTEVDVVVPLAGLDDRDVACEVAALRAEGHAVWVTDLPDVDEARRLATHIDGAVINPDSFPAEAVQPLVWALEENALPVIACGVHDPAVWDRLRDCGVAAVSGSPDLFGSGEVNAPTDHLQAFRLIALLSDDSSSIDELDDAVRANVDLSLRVVKLASSAAAGRHRAISSIRDALVMSGRQRVREWVFLTTAQTLGEAGRELATSTLIRARFSELLAPKISPEHVGEAFLAGLLSGVVDHFDVDPLELVENLPVTDSIADAVTKGTGELMPMLELVRAYERHGSSAPESPLGPTEVTYAYLDALAWASTSMRRTHPGEAQASGLTRPRHGELSRRMRAAQLQQAESSTA